ncbi:chromosome condensation protein CrcB [Streptomyces sp. CB00316]|uniref:FluC/FEX family fluoride channel n=1 Tax=unclassified Streptomyces TaxID=2593676 RepID=UPI00093DA4DB|nr:MULTISPECIES: CrcB family protein [unclassified Streptomyces]MBT2381001.1 CrcB family protein [Streptomyces sp. ISL-111]MBT2424716.1 CrcB family protein [Streptomyces sp. ISL-112]MBT2466102.1 CrcB family protein [Streptomyces sp. ISL-63]OKJ22885.1 chromosome condensation protein CrcB [Streptomyces sp. CB00316]
MSEQAPDELPEPGPPAAPQARVLGAVAAGGALGAVARYGALVLWPATEGGFPWTVAVVNVSGCALIGVLMVLTVERGRVTHPLVRPFLGVGVLGGFTTFSTYAADVSGLLVRQELLTAVAYMAVTVVAALAAVWAGAVVTRRLLDRGERSVERGRAA